MTLISYLKTMTLMTLVCWSTWVYIIFTINPKETNSVGFLLFYVALYLSLVGTAAVFGFIIRFGLLKQRLAFRSAKEAFRQSFLFSLLIIISLFLEGKDLFTWVNLLFLVIGISILEFFLLDYAKK